MRSGGDHCDQELAVEFWRRRRSRRREAEEAGGGREAGGRWAEGGRDS